MVKVVSTEDTRPLVQEEASPLTNLVVHYGSARDPTHDAFICHAASPTGNLMTHGTLQEWLRDFPESAGFLDAI